MRVLKLQSALFLALIYVSLNLHAQLTVRNDAYIFVDDRLVFVENNVNLQEADSKIYLRNESQLIQGAGTTGNSGLGELSIQQRGTTHEFAYNYWCSPVGNNSATLGNEAFRVNLIDDATGLITSNDALFTDNAAGSSSPLRISRLWLHTFEASDQYSGWIFQGDAGSINAGLGFSMKGTSGSGNNQLYEFRGKPNNGTITNTVATANWTLIGNPYPSAVDARDFIHDADNVATITGVLHFWEQDLSVLSHVLADYVGGYALYTISSDGMTETYVHAPFNTYNEDGTINTTGGTRTSGKNLGRYIPVGQGFMVEGITSGVVSMKNEYRVYEKESPTNGEFFRTEQNNIEEEFFTVEEVYQRFRLNIDFNDIYTRQLVQTFHDTKTTEDFDYGYDMKHVFSLASDAYWRAEQFTAYTAQALPLDVDTTVLPLDIYLSENQTIKIRLADVQNFETDQPIFLYDAQSNSYTDLTTEDFEIHLEANYYESRFQVVFSERNALNNDEFANSTFDIRHNIENKELSIYNFTSAIDNISFYDMLGKRVFSIDNLQSNNLHTLSTAFLSSGIYIVKVSGSDNSIESRKFIVKK